MVDVILDHHVQMVVVSITFDGDSDSTSDAPCVGNNATNYNNVFNYNQTKGFVFGTGNNTIKHNSSNMTTEEIIVIVGSISGVIMFILIMIGCIVICKLYKNQEIQNLRIERILRLRNKGFQKIKNTEIDNDSDNENENLNQSPDGLEMGHVTGVSFGETDSLKQET